MRRYSYPCTNLFSIAKRLIQYNHYNSPPNIHSQTTCTNRRTVPDSSYIPFTGNSAVACFGFASSLLRLAPGILRTPIASLRSFFAHAKPKTFLTFPFGREGCGERAKKMKENFWFCYRHFKLRKENNLFQFVLPVIPLVTSSFHFANRLFSPFSCQLEALPPTLYGVLGFAHTSQAPRMGHSHSFAWPARCLLVFA